jgi:N-formylglutamate amidohydrolase
MAQRNPTSADIGNSTAIRVHDPDLPSFTLRRDGNPRLVISSPHSGRHYPDDFLKASCRTWTELRQVEDGLLDILLTRVPLDGVLIAAEFPRSYVDVNRQENELDPEMFISLPDAVSTKESRYTRSGLGVIPSRLAQHLPIYDQLLTEQEYIRRMKGCYYPFHQTLTSLLETAKSHGAAVLLDIHSMPSDASAKQTDIVIGDLHGQSAEAWLPQLAKEIFTAAGYDVRLNTPFAGGYITRHYGQPDQGVSTIQIEINRRLYMDENRFRLQPRWVKISETIEQLIQNVSQRLNQQSV